MLFTKTQLPIMYCDAFAFIKLHTLIQKLLH